MNLTDANDAQGWISNHLVYNALGEMVRLARPAPAMRPQIPKPWREQRVVDLGGRDRETGHLRAPHSA